MDDITMKIYEAIIDNKEIMNHVQKNNIKFFDYPNAQEIKDVVIVIDPLGQDTPTNFGDDFPIIFEDLYQIDVFVKQRTNLNARLIAKDITFEIAKTLRMINIYDTGGSIKPEYIKDFNIYRQTKRFEAKQSIA
ncbi:MULTISPECIES: hypothetical protein [Staphylococcus]|uniref:hypothetical protein n=1 Tax=Staphylococcus TaxID=1279 RepID=UPI0007AE3EED|nr:MULTISPECIES: hypothetical protein [Staphylococcus]KZG77762.1 hypothetical protein A4R95_09585 [Staphylococcus epidermidis]KZG83961.1 hypothetical protein A4R84_04590 [Staphylococcus epidermidis]MBE7320340.1 hypothetical protein [Staphylococcus epidermidis]MCC3755502.1 hypothetical protein [Staphylococcus capitis]MDH8729582.1 hypothetical protein [Staphylococcus capitis]